MQTLICMTEAIMEIYLTAFLNSKMDTISTKQLQLSQKMRRSGMLIAGRFLNFSPNAELMKNTSKSIALLVINGMILDSTVLTIESFSANIFTTFVCKMY